MLELSGTYETCTHKKVRVFNPRFHVSSILQKGQMSRLSSQFWR